MEVGNEIFINDGSQWSFRNCVAKHFDEHVRQSIPLYDVGHELICHLSDFFIHDNALCYELGSATGNLIGRVYQHHKSKKDVRFIGIEEVEEMNSIAQLKFPEVEFLTESVENVKLKPSNLIMSYYFLQFVLPEKRIEILSKIYKSLVEGGAFILVEKEIISDSKVSKLIVSNYIKFKQEQGFSPEEILSKQLSLEGVMINYTHHENKEMLQHVGFHHIETIMRYGEFNGYICFK